MFPEDSYLRFQYPRTQFISGYDIIASGTVHSAPPFDQSSEISELWVEVDRLVVLAGSRDRQRIVWQFPRLHRLGSISHNHEFGVIDGASVVNNWLAKEISCIVASIRLSYHKAASTSDGLNQGAAVTMPAEVRMSGWDCRPCKHGNSARRSLCEFANHEYWSGAPRRFDWLRAERMRTLF